MTSKPSNRETLINTAVEFLTHPKVKSASLSAKRAFLQSRGLTPEEMDLAFKLAEEVKREPLVPAEEEASKTVTRPVPSRASSLYRAIATSVLALGFVGGTVVAVKSYLMPLMKRLGDEFVYFREKRYEELQQVLVAIQESQQEHCTRMEGLMHNFSSEMREMHTQREEFLRQQNEEMKTLLTEIRDIVKNQARDGCGPSNETEAMKNDGGSPGSSVHEDPVPEDHGMASVFQEVAAHDSEVANQADGQSFARSESIPRQWLRSSPTKNGSEKSDSNPQIADFNPADQQNVNISHAVDDKGDIAGED